MEKTINYSVPQGSLLCPVLFNAYCSTLVEVIPTGISINGFADDHLLQKSCKPGTKSEIETVELLETTMAEVVYWMKENRLKLNPNKTEFFKFGDQTHLEKSKVVNINICNTVITPSKVVQYLGVCFDSQMNLKHHATMKCKAPTLNLRKIPSIRQFLDQSICEVLVCSLVLTRLDYSNGIHYEASECVICKLQKVKIFAAKMVLKI